MTRKSKKKRKLLSQGLFSIITLSHTPEKKNTRQSHGVVGCLESSTVVVRIKKEVSGYAIGVQRARLRTHVWLFGVVAEKIVLLIVILFQFFVEGVPKYFFSLHIFYPIRTNGWQTLLGRGIVVGWPIIPTA